MSIFPQSLPLPPLSLTRGILPEILMHLKLNWLYFFLLFSPPATHKPYLNTQWETLYQSFWDEVKVDKLSSGPHTVSCELRLRISSAGGAWWVCVREDWLAGYWQGVYVSVCTGCVSMRIDFWVCVPLPLVSLLRKTLTSSRKGTYYPQPITAQKNNFKSL